VPLIFTVELLTKLAPFTVRVKAPEPAMTVEGCREATVGAGLLDALIVRVSEFEVPPPGVGLVAVMVAVPVEEISAARMAAVSCVALM